MEFEGIFEKAVAHGTADTATFAGKVRGVRHRLSCLRGGSPPNGSTFSGWRRPACEQINAQMIRMVRRLETPTCKPVRGNRLLKELARDLERNGLLPKDFSVSEVGCCHFVMDADELGSPYHSGKLSRFERYLRRAKGRVRGEGDHLSAGEMTIARPPLPIRQPALLRAGVARRRAATEGTRIA
jgi:hypothetical protein